MPEWLYKPGTEVRIITSNRLHYAGPVVRCAEDWLSLRDRVMGHNININLRLVESLEVVPDPGEPREACR